MRHLPNSIGCSKQLTDRITKINQVNNILF